MKLQENHINQLKELALRLIDQRNAKILIPPLANESGYWFGGGNIIQGGRWKNFNLWEIPKCRRFNNWSWSGRARIRICNI